MIDESPITSRKIGWLSLGALFSSLLGSPVEWLKNSLVFRPNANVNSSPAEYGLPYRDVRFGGRDGSTLHGWYIPSLKGPTDSQEPLFIWFHGNGGNIAHRLSHLRLLYQHVGGSHFLFDYRGYGKSQGKPSVAGILADGRDAITLAHACGWASGRPVVYFGESLGAAVVVVLAIEAPPSRVILLAPFYSLRAMGNLRLPSLAFLVDHDLNSARIISQVQRPLLVIHGTDDKTVPFRQGSDLYTLASQPKRFYAVDGAGHTNVHEVGNVTYAQVIREFVLGPVS